MPSNTMLIVCTLCGVLFGSLSSSFSCNLTLGHRSDRSRYISQYGSVVGSMGESVDRKCNCTTQLEQTIMECDQKIQTIVRQQEERAKTTTENSVPSNIQPPEPEPAQHLPTFTDLLKRSKSDKYGIHHYEHYYKDWFEPYRMMTNLTFLEIGVLKGESIRLWKDYFTSPTRKIYGLGYGLPWHIKKSLHQEFGSDTNVQLLEGDQSQNTTMLTVRELGPFDILIDDGSHYPQHVIFTLFSLWTSIKPGGLYIIEDLETSYWSTGNDIYGYVLNGTGFGASPYVSAVEKVKQFIDLLPMYQLNLNQKSNIMEDDRSICNIEWGRNVVKLRKCSDHEMEFHPNFQSRHGTPSETFDDWLHEARKSNPSTLA